MRRMAPGVNNYGWECALICGADVNPSKSNRRFSVLYLGLGGGLDNTFKLPG